MCKTSHCMTPSQNKAEVLIQDVILKGINDVYMAVKMMKCSSETPFDLQCSMQGEYWLMVI